MTAGGSRPANSQPPAAATSGSDVSGALLAMLYGRPEEDAGAFTGKASRIRDLAVANVAGMELFFASVTLLAALVTADQVSLATLEPRRTGAVSGETETVNLTF